MFCVHFFFNHLLLPNLLKFAICSCNSKNSCSRVWMQLSDN